MAVRHGYGKIAGADALVFAYDTGDTRNSYRGEPTTNLATLDLSDTSVWYNEDAATTTKELQAETLFGYPVYKFASRPGSIWITPFAFNGYDKANGPITVSAYIRNMGAIATVSTYLSGDYSTDSLGNSNYKTIPTDGVWRRYSWTRTAADMNTANQLEFRTSGNNMQISCPQVEYKLHPTPIVEGTRSATQGLLDLTGNRSISLTNVSFDSNAQLTWDGTNDTLDTGIPVTDLPALSNFTIECIAKIDSYPTVAPPNGYGNTTRCGVLVGAAFYSGTALYWYGNTSGDQCAIYAYIRGNDAYRTAGPFYMVPGNHHHLVLVNNNETTTLHLYADGIQIGSVGGPTQEYNSGLAATAGNIGISKAQVDGGGEAVYSYLPVDVPVTKIYNRALTADEVRNNFRHYKTRFNI